MAIQAHERKIANARSTEIFTKAILGGSDRRTMRTAAPYRISGHESFSCRYTWLPKAVRGLTENGKLFSDEAKAMVVLGLGKNMVRSVRFWAQVAGMTTPGTKGDGHLLTDLGRALLGERGLDPFLEDIRTLWLLHWNLSTDTKTPLLAWDFLLNRWQEPEMVPSVVLRALEREAARQGESPSPVTINQHWDTFLHTYVPTRGRKGEVQEDNLDCPLVELGLIVRVGERPVDKAAGRAEPIFAFRREEKPDITPELFVYSLNDFWNRRHPEEGTMTFREVAHGHGSPGQIYKLPEDDVRARVERLAQQTKSSFAYTESSNLQRVQRRERRESIDLLDDVFRQEGRAWLKSAL
ncbi:MAG: DUF4007 family protein [Limisphaerales bacterium]